MRWYTKHHEEGDKRTRTVFAWFPISAWNENIRETVWLEWVNIEQEY